MKKTIIIILLLCMLLLGDLYCINFESRPKDEDVSGFRVFKVLSEQWALI